LKANDLNVQGDAMTPPPLGEYRVNGIKTMKDYQIVENDWASLKVSKKLIFANFSPTISYLI